MGSLRGILLIFGRAVSALIQIRPDCNKRGGAQMNTKFRVKRNTLLLIAGLVWMAAGVNILRIGVVEWGGHWHWPLVESLTAAVVFGLFFRFVFSKMVNKHSRRIRGYQAEQIPVYRFFDGKSYLIMACMITFGIVLRASHLLPPLFIGVFYTGLGASLAGAGIFFVVRFCRRFAEQPSEC